MYSACVESECTFQPDTEATKYRNSRMLMVAENRDPNRTGGSMGFRSRSHKKPDNSLTNELFDPDSGQPYFKPLVGRGPKNQSREPRAVGSHLYANSKALKEKIDAKKQQALADRDSKAKTVFTQDQTNRIVERLKIQRFSALFKQLDSDADGQVSANRIDITQLSPELLEVLTPLFCEMEELA